MLVAHTASALHKQGTELLGIGRLVTSLTLFFVSNYCPFGVEYPMSDSANLVYKGPCPYYISGITNAPAWG
jgi:hypothetical protein